MDGQKTIAIYTLASGNIVKLPALERADGKTPFYLHQPNEHLKLRTERGLFDPVTIVERGTPVAYNIGGAFINDTITEVNLEKCTMTEPNHSISELFEEE